MSSNWVKFESVGGLLEAQKYHFANTMAATPHCYTRRAEWANPDQFVWVVNYIREHGYREKYGGRQYTKLDVNGFAYWTMGDPIASTILINRARASHVAPYDDISKVYTSLHVDKESHAQNKKVAALLGDLSDKSVLDIGCGAGLLLRYLTPQHYLGIDPSQGMLCEMCHIWPRAETYCTPLKSFVPPQSEYCMPYRFDVVCGLFGVGSYLSPEELLRVKLLVKEGGMALMMFYKPDYEPLTHQFTHEVPYHDHYDKLAEAFPGFGRTHVDGHTVTLWRNDD